MLTSEQNVFLEFKNDAHKRLNHLFLNQFKSKPIPSLRLQESITYALTNGGKRIRPVIVYTIGKMLGASWEACDIPALAVECIHTYSLIHDDLPAMDNSDLRRGNPTCHIQFDEATAVLTGDALLTFAFNLLATKSKVLSSKQRLEMIRILAKASGEKGMCSGQMLDMQGAQNIEDIDRIYRLKTGALFKSSFYLGLVAANSTDTATAQEIEIIADSLGLAFQLQDDLLDASDSELTGKPIGIDIKNKKITYVSLLGHEATKLRIKLLLDTALSSVEKLGENKNLLKGLIRNLIQRRE